MGVRDGPNWAGGRRHCLHEANGKGTTEVRLHAGLPYLPVMLVGLLGAMICHLVSLVASACASALKSSVEILCLVGSSAHVHTARDSHEHIGHLLHRRFSASRCCFIESISQVMHAACMGRARSTSRTGCHRSVQDCFSTLCTWIPHPGFP